MMRSKVGSKHRSKRLNGVLYLKDVSESVVSTKTEVDFIGRKKERIQLIKNAGFSMKLALMKHATSSSFHHHHSLALSKRPSHCSF